MPRKPSRGATLDFDQAFVSLNGYGALRIAQKIKAERNAWRAALGVSQGFHIPDKPTPATMAEIEAEIATLTELENAAFRASLCLPPGPEHESHALAMVKYRDRRALLIIALREGQGL